MTPAIVITGPTACGKSDVADRLAEQLGSEVVSADAMQVYRGMDIGTAKTPLSERRVPLRLVDIVEVGEAYSAARYQLDARAEIDRLLASGRVPIICGGTGLYIRAAIDDMRFPSGQIDSERRVRYHEMAERLGADGLHRVLAERDPASAAEIHPHNVTRTIRALEMADEGVSYARQRQGFSSPTSVYPSVQVALTRDRAALYRRIDERVDAMMETGLLQEVLGLLDRGAREALTAMQAIGYKELIDYIDGACTLEAAVELIKQRSRRYAKRQLAWCRRDARITWVNMDEMDATAAAAHIRRLAGI